MTTDSEHGISPRVWFGYLEGSLPAQERAGVDAHLDSCAECRRLHLQIRAWERVIQEEAGRVASASDQDPEVVDRLAAGALRRIRETEPAAIASPGLCFHEAVLFLRGVLDPLCGAGAARNAVRLAAERSCPDVDLRKADVDWDVFVRNLSASIGAVYGSSARVLIEHVGALVRGGLLP